MTKDSATLGVELVEGDWTKIHVLHESGGCAEEVHDHQVHSHRGRPAVCELYDFNGVIPEIIEYAPSQDLCRGRIKDINVKIFVLLGNRSR